ncbi:MAG: AEC family transporter [Yoonia sp.]|jgi:malonate transporter and related proteins|nr:AEC family transporter [Yoonia sp.]
MVFLTILLGLLPSFLMVGLGGIVKNRLSVNAWQGLDKLNFEILFPALLFVSAASRPIDPSNLFRMAPAVWSILSIGLLLGLTVRRIGPDSFLDFAGAWQTSWRFNSALGLVAVGTLSRANDAQMAVAIGLAVPVANIFAVAALSRGGALGFAASVKRVALNPFLLASIAGVIVGLTGLIIPAPVIAPLQMLAAAAIPIALISVGATMNWRALARLNGFNGAICAIKLLALPAVTLMACLTFNISPAIGSVLVVFAALPTASAAHVLAAGFGANRELVATLVAQSTLLGAVTLPVWIAMAELLL